VFQLIQAVYPDLYRVDNLTDEGGLHQVSIFFKKTISFPSGEKVWALLTSRHHEKDETNIKQKPGKDKRSGYFTIISIKGYKRFVMLAPVVIV
jgi:hypothetical protein